MTVSTAPAETLSAPSSLALQRSTALNHHADDDKEDREREALASTPTPLSRLVVCQNPMSVTLDGPAIFALSTTIVLLLHLVGPAVVELLASLVPVALLVRNDFHNFLLLGRGGTSSTIQGYLKICCLRLLCLRDPFTAPTVVDPDRLPREGILARKAALPYRPGPRPLVAGIAPQRQLDQRGSQRCYLALRRAMEQLAQRRPLKFGTERSCLEKHGLALFARFPLQTNCQGEICHVHDSDHSMHLCLHPDDSREILQKGWGQRHPLAREEGFLRMPVSRDFVMIYAPRDDQELQTVCRIISAAIWYILAEDVDFDLEAKAPLNLVLSSQTDK